ncbi:MAG: hypothetical protein NC079_03050 [Clostridium sp.]|nr:hypothetical protein [Acetatifactor muris]MCM1525891.1 hypothetical protein [Bacteroides sp.]MCM1562569.1 hypothetical protein [Clostridium sp.]
MKKLSHLEIKQDKQNKTVGLGICILCAIVLTGCAGMGRREGPDYDLSDLPTSTAASSKEELSETEQAIRDYEIKYATGTFTMEDYQALAALYGEQGMIRRQRDLLEQSYRLFDDSAAFEPLQKLYVNVEEDPSVREDAELMLQNLETPGYLNEGIHLIGSDEWFQNMMPKLAEGSRNYFVQQNDRVRLVIRAGYDGEGRSYSTVWYYGSEDNVTVLKAIDGNVQVMETTLADGNYDGPFTLWVLDSITGSIYKEQGVFAQGIYTGEYSLDICQGSAPGDPFDLWNGREDREYKTYTAQADEEGAGELEQFAGALDSRPEFTPYTPVAVSKDSGKESESPQIRVYDGEIQWLSGDTWVALGSVEEYCREDPFRVYDEWKRQTDASMQKEGTDPEGIALPNPQTPSAKPSTPTPSAPAPSKPTPSAPSKPAPSVTPATPATPAPAPVPDDDDNDGDSGNNGGPDNPPDNSGSDDGNSDDGGGSGGGSDNSGDGGNDVDVEWTPDLL